MSYPPFWADPGCAETGKRIFMRRCASCHTVFKDEGHAEGPNLSEVVGRKIGSVEGFSFRPEFKRLGEECTSNRWKYKKIPWISKLVLSINVWLVDKKSCVKISNVLYFNSKISDKITRKILPWKHKFVSLNRCCFLCRQENLRVLLKPLKILAQLRFKNKNFKFKLQLFSIENCGKPRTPQQVDPVQHQQVPGQAGQFRWRGRYELLVAEKIPGKSRPGGIFAQDRDDLNREEGDLRSRRGQQPAEEAGVLQGEEDVARRREDPGEDGQHGVAAHVGANRRTGGWNGELRGKWKRGRVQLRGIDRWKRRQKQRRVRRCWHRWKNDAWRS